MKEIKIYAKTLAFGLLKYFKHFIIKIPSPII